MSTTPQHNPWLDAVTKGAPFKFAITCTGRRVVSKVFDYATEKAILAAQSSESVDDIMALYQKVIQRHVYEGTTLDSAKPLVDYIYRLTTVEELDLIMLARITSYGTKVEFSYNCPSCGHTSALSADVRSMRRELLECGDPSCICHTVNEIGRDTSDRDWDCIEYMKTEWVKVPEDHLEKAPPVRTITLHYLKGASIHFRLPKAETNGRFADLALQRDEKLVQKYLEYCITKISWPEHDVDASSKVDVSQILTEWPLSIRIDVKDKINSVIGGIDQTVLAKCSNSLCRKSRVASVPFSPLFLYPQKELT